MYLLIFILTRVLFVASMVFIIGYVFGSFSKNKTLTLMAKISTILIFVLFIATGVFIRSGRGFFGQDHDSPTCLFRRQDTSLKN